MNARTKPLRRFPLMACWLLVLVALALAAAQGGVGAGNPGVTAQFSGTVVDERGRRVAGAAVDCYQSDPSRVWVCGTGTGTQAACGHRPERAFTISAPPGETLVVVKKNGLAPAWKTWSSFLVDSTDPLVLTRTHHARRRGRG